MPLADVRKWVLFNVPESFVIVTGPVIPGGSGGNCDGLLPSGANCKVRKFLVCKRD